MIENLNDLRVCQSLASAPIQHANRPRRLTEVILDVSGRVELHADSFCLFIGLCLGFAISSESLCKSLRASKSLGSWPQNPFQQ